MPLSLPESQPAETAVLLIDLQHGLFDPHSTEQRAQELLGHAVAISQAARLYGAHVVHCTKFDRPDFAGWKTNTPAWRARARALTPPMLDGSRATSVLEPLGPDAGDLVVPRSRGASPFTGTELDPILRNLGCSTLVFAGISLNVAVIGSCVEAISLGYEVIVAEDAVLGFPYDYGEQMLRHSFRVMATVVSTAEILRAWAERWAPPSDAP